MRNGEDHDRGIDHVARLRTPEQSSCVMSIGFVERDDVATAEEPPQLGLTTGSTDLRDDGCRRERDDARLEPDAVVCSSWGGVVLAGTGGDPPRTPHRFMGTSPAATRSALQSLSGGVELGLQPPSAAAWTRLSSPSAPVLVEVTTAGEHLALTARTSGPIAAEMVRAAGQHAAVVTTTFRSSPLQRRAVPVDGERVAISVSREELPTPACASRNTIKQACGQIAVERADCFYRRRRREAFGRAYGEVIDPLDETVRVDFELLGQPSPVSTADLVEPIFAAHPHRHAQLRHVHVLVRKGTRDVVQRREAHLTTCEQNRVVLGVGIRACDDPAVGERVHEPVDAVDRRRGRTDLLPKQLNDLLGTRPAITLVLRGGWETECLTHVLLMDPRDGAVVRSHAVVTLDHDRSFFTE